MSVYTIDGSEVSGRNWRHEVQPAELAAQRSESWPGDPNRYVVAGVEPPPTIHVTGALVAADITAINTMLLNFAAMRRDTVLHTIGISGDTFTLCYLQSVAFTGPLQHSNDGVRRDVQFTWWQMRH